MRNAVKFYKFLDTARRFCLKFIYGRRFISLIVSLVKFGSCREIALLIKFYVFAETTLR